MQDGGEKLTIAEFAQRAGCTPQRVSQLLRNRLKEFQVIENGRKYVLSSGLQEVLQARERQGYKANSETVSNSCETVSSAEAQAAEAEKLRADLAETRAALDSAQDLLKAAELKAAAADAERKRADAAEQHCTALQNQLQAMQTQLDGITAALQAEQEHAAELTQALTAAQALHAGTIATQKQLAMQEEAPADQSDTGTESEPEAKQKRRSLFARIFRKEHP